MKKYNYVYYLFGYKSFVEIQADNLRIANSLFLSFIDEFKKRGLSVDFRGEIIK